MVSRRSVPSSAEKWGHSGSFLVLTSRRGFGGGPHPDPGNRWVWPRLGKGPLRMKSSYELRIPRGAHPGLESNDKCPQRRKAERDLLFLGETVS